MPKGSDLLLTLLPEVNLTRSILELFYHYVTILEMD